MAIIAAPAITRTLLTGLGLGAETGGIRARRTKPDGDGRYGQSDLAGNVNERNLDFFAAYIS